MASFLSDAVLLGDASQKRRVRRALRAGIRVYAIGGSITASFGGCFGEGCDRRISHQPRKSEPSQLRDSGFLSMFMRELNHSWPNPRHALFNRGIGGSGAGLLLSGCLSAFVRVKSATNSFNWPKTLRLQANSSAALLRAA
jgi:hypothetical protein